jgi:hypothetical protein
MLRFSIGTGISSNTLLHSTCTIRKDSSILTSCGAFGAHGAISVTCAAYVIEALANMTHASIK